MTKTPYFDAYERIKSGIYPLNFRIDSFRYLEKAIMGDFRAIDMAFSWSQTPQGHVYWSDRYRGRVELSDIDIAQLKSWAKEYQKNGFNFPYNHHVDNR